MARGVRVTTALLVLAIAVVLVAFRIEVVNASMPASDVHEYSTGEPVPYSPEVGLNGDPSSCATFTILGVSVLDDETLASLAPDYSDGVIAAGSASEVKVVVVRMLLENNSDGEASLPLSLLSAREGAWANASDLMLLAALDSDTELAKLSPGETREIVVPFCAYDVQFGFNNEAWQCFGSRGLSLVVNAGMDNNSVDLDGAPEMSASLSSDGDGGQR